MIQTIYAPDQYYHIYNRGVNRQPIFFTQRNWTFFLQRINEYFTSDKAIIIAYCLMPNHYHLLIYLLDAAFSFSVMQPFVTSYTKAINKEQDRVGALFQGRFKGILVDSNDYLVHVSRYIHTQPGGCRAGCAAGRLGLLQLSRLHRPAPGQAAASPPTPTPTARRWTSWWVQLKHDSALERARTMQRNFVAHYLKNRGEKDAALVAYHGDDRADWRFSLVRMDYRLRVDGDSGRVKVEEETDPGAALLIPGGPARAEPHRPAAALPHPG